MAESLDHLLFGGGELRSGHNQEGILATMTSERSRLQQGFGRSHWAQHNGPVTRAALAPKDARALAISLGCRQVEAHHTTAPALINNEVIDLSQCCFHFSAGKKRKQYHNLHRILGSSRDWLKVLNVLQRPEVYRRAAFIRTHAAGTGLRLAPPFEEHQTIHGQLPGAPSSWQPGTVQNCDSRLPSRVPRPH